MQEVGRRGRIVLESIVQIQRAIRTCGTRMIVVLAGLLFPGTLVAQSDLLAQTDLDLVTTDGWWLPPNAAEHGGKVDGIFTMIFIVTVITGIAVFAVLGYILYKYRHQEGRKAIFLHGSHRLEMIWTITPAVILVIMGILSIRAWADIRMSEPAFGEEVTEVEVLAEQFQWNIRYPGMDGKFGTMDDIGTFDKQDPDKSAIPGNIHVPVGKTVRVHLMSRDVLHSFFLPNMRQKLDAVPGIRGTMKFTPTKVGKYDLLCAELCGPQHYSMSGALYVMSQEDYDAWLGQRNAEIRDILSYYGIEVGGGDWGGGEGGTEEAWPDEDEPVEESEEPEPEAEAPAEPEAEAPAEDEAEATAKTEPEPEPEAATDLPSLIGTETPKDAIVGRVLYEGPVRQKPINPGTDPVCAKAHEQEPIIDESIVLGPDNVLQNVFVEVTGGLPDKKWPVPEEPVVLDQLGCRYIPHVFGVMADQPLLIRNSDRTNHNVHGLAKKNEIFNFGQPKIGMTETLRFAKPEDFKIKCDVHAWMSTWCHVVEHPFYAVTDEKGAFEIAGLPAGEYELTYWHETLGEQKVDVELGDSAAEAETVTFKPAARGRRR